MLVTMLKISLLSNHAFTLLIHGGQNYELFFILETLLSNHIKPSLIKKEQKTVVY